MNPYKRIIRPIHSDFFGHEHLLDNRYCAETHQLIHAYHIIQNDFQKLMDYIELHDSNKNTFSHRIYELILRICTEFENNCKGILEANGYSVTRNLNIQDYFKLNTASRLNEYVIRINNWFPAPIEFSPFEEWNSSNFSSLTWYQNYNKVKHDRSNFFHLASLDNLVKSLGGLFVLLYSQFADHCFNQFQMSMGVLNNNRFRSTQNSIFCIKPPNNWSESIVIDTSISNGQPMPFSIYNFN